ncbi:hypothetical protein SpCBS45565_g05730 [Spizellomyces sp. 'palustris']|nr:hypothetical protein SpCBS45565_g05730 [Spizellomyces sp. 'palustris']
MSPNAAISPNITTPVSSHAYVFYATNTEYACSVLINMALIRKWGSVIRFVFIITDKVPKAYVEKAASHFGAHIVHVTPPPPPAGSNPNDVATYGEVMTKLLAFSLYTYGYTRIMTLDADQLVRKNLDHLFELPHVDIAIPRAYWYVEFGGVDKQPDGRGGVGWAASPLMVIDLSPRLWKRVQGRLANLEKNEYDMDLINHEFGNEVLLLPGRYVTLNNHWDTETVPKWSSFWTAESAKNRTTLSRVYEEEVEVVHFSASIGRYGKPWTVPNGTIRENAHPVLKGMYLEWWTSANSLCPEWGTAI